MFAALAAHGCIRGTPSLDAAPCPCVDDYVCCEALDRCLRPDEACPGAAPDAAPARDASTGPDAPTRRDAAPVPDASPGRDAAPAADAGLALVSLTPAEGPREGGTPVEIVGTGFGPGEPIDVRFGVRAAASVERLDDRHLRVVAPPGPWDVSAVDVVVSQGEAAVVVAGGYRYVLPTLVDATEASGLWGGRGISVSVFDADGDGDRDLITARTVPEQPAEWRADPGLSFTAATEGAAWAALPYFESAVPVDLDARDPLELVVLRAWTPAVERPYVVERFDAAEPSLTSMPVSDAASSWDGLCPMDLDGDGDVDLAGVRISPLGEAVVRTSASVFLNENGRLQAVTPSFDLALPGVATDAPSLGMVAADLDADGFVDLVLSLGGLPWLYRGTPSGPELVPDAFPPPPPGTSLGGPVAGDLDADGALDLLFWNTDLRGEPWFKGGVFVFRGHGARFTLEAPWPLPGPPTLCPDALDPAATLPAGLVGGALGDLDLDGDLDLILPSPSDLCPVPARWLESGRVDTGEAFLAAHEIGADLPRRMAGALADDLDADGDVDVVANAWFSSDRTRLYRNNTVENRGTSGAAAGGWLRATVRNRQGFVPFGARVELDLDGPADAPDWAPGPGRLAVRVVGGGGNEAYNDGVVSFGTGSAQGPLHLRVLLPDGPLAVRVEGSDRAVALGP